jgi:hypothetical protein
VSAVIVKKIEVEKVEDERIPIVLEGTKLTNAFCMTCLSAPISL